jgi:SNF2 family DNA or RNA helicase
MNQVLVSAKHKMVGVPTRGDLQTLFPNARTVTLEGNRLLLVSHGIVETKLLRNMGFDVPAPILTHYDFEGGTPFDVQRKTVAMLTSNDRAYVLNGMGTGKTKAALWAWRFLHRHGHAGKLLVVAPLSTLNFTWAREVFNTLPDVRVAVLHGSRKKRLSLLSDPEIDIYIINHDGVGVIAEALNQRLDIDSVVLDELAVYRNGTAERTKVTRKVTARMKWVWGMTGAPTPNAPTDAWGQCSIVTPGTVPKWFNRFRDEVMYKLSAFKWAPKRDATDKVFAAMQPSVRFTLDEVLELPDLVERTIDVDMGPKQAKVYKQMKDHAIAAVASHEITAMNAGAVLNKLLQISTGYVYTRDRTVVPLDNSERMTALVDAVNATDRKVLVFVPFVHALHAIRAKLEEEGHDVRAVSGATPKSERDETFRLFQSTDKVKVIVAHPQCMSHGLTLTAADTIIWFAPLPNLEIFEQANARIRRIGQKHRQQILMLQATPAERQVYTRLRAKQRVQNMLLEMFADASL